ncbi:MAG: M3 family oligoendopeptidase [Phycisphaerae bacterium]|nr:M3 family oligoendopeptidase [Phycisphaerae bacterium]
MSKKEVNFDALVPFRDRKFVPADVDMTSPDQVCRLYEQLIAREISSAAELEQLLLDRSELESALYEKFSALRILMTCQTDDKTRADAYQHMVKNVQPAISPLGDKLDRKYLEADKIYPLDAERFKQYKMAIQTDVELFREENIELSTQESLLGQEYQTLSGAMTVEFDGQEKTLPMMSKYFQVADRSVREQAWKLVAQRRGQDADKIDEIFDKLRVLRTKISANAGFDNYRDYMFKSKHRFDYTVKDCKDYHDAVEKLLVPLQAKIFEKRKEQMGLDKLRPWDIGCDPLGRDPLKPFEEVEEFQTGAQKMFQQVDPELGAQFQEMIDTGMLDLASRKGKAPGGYQSSLSEARKPFIFMNAVGSDNDLRTLLHEGGHAFHSYAAAEEDLLAYRHAAMEYCEVASMSMELLAAPYLGEFYSEEDMKRSRYGHLEGIVNILIWVAIVDSYQHWLYENPDHTKEQRTEAWLKIRKRFGSEQLDWQGLEKEHELMWHRQLHIFLYPFYYIEYGIAQLGALQIWLQSKKDPAEALKNYRYSLSLGGSKGLAELFAAAKIKFDFSAANIKPLSEAVSEELEKMS